MNRKELLSILPKDEAVLDVAHLLSLRERIDVELDKCSGGRESGITLRFRGKENPRSIPKRIPAATLSPVFSFGTNRIYRGDNLGILKALLPKYRGKVKLIYLDPPFSTGRTFRVGGAGRTGGAVVAYQDHLTGSNYLSFLYERLVFCKQLLAENGVLYVHLCPKMAPYVKILLDELFGCAAHSRTIIWKRTGSHPNARSYANVHDVILFYPKSARFEFTPDYEPYPKNEIKSRFPHVDEGGRRFSCGDLAGESLKTAHDPAYRYEWNGHHRIWRCPRQTMERLDREGLIYYSRTGLPRKKQFLDEAKGVAPTDVWEDIPPIHARSPERIGYPTQKPEKLLERIIRSSTCEGDLVLDPFCGSGSTLAVATKLMRQWIGIDNGDLALTTCRKRFAIALRN